MSDSKKLNLSVQSMTCASCVGRVDRALAADPTLDSAEVVVAAAFRLKELG